MEFKICVVLEWENPAHGGVASRIGQVVSKISLTPEIEATPSLTSDLTGDLIGVISVQAEIQQHWQMECQRMAWAGRSRMVQVSYGVGHLVTTTFVQLGNSTGSGKPTVFGLRVAQVRVRCLDLATRALPRTLTAGWRVSTGLQGTPSGKIFSTILTFTDIISS